ncbi:cleavage and polyadenylation specificity factor subunit [Ephemerocybe angulata]|uniref:Cleavage and polyadenylation specificity factor subunit 2 n=1 Tax=Ephemerocybe angulata TaxID=980116 RepID=A0A8H6MBB6_9AGAR|nr:cleavage and polyadenylation specificity factor subunit [Tulosesus angulatus]
MITFTPLAGAARSTSTTPLSYVLQVDDVRILLDCGSPDWMQEPSPFSENMQTDEESSTPPWQEYCDNLKKVAPTIDLVLLSHGDLAHCGLYPWANTHWGLKAPAYTTLPVQAMGRIAVTEDVEGLRAEINIGEEPEKAEGEDVEMEDKPEEEARQETPVPGPKGKCVATLIEVQDSFDSINTLRYSQPIHLQGKCQGLTITAFSAGHTLGGTIWKIRSPSSGTILYAVNINHMKERHLDGTVLMMRPGNTIFESLVRPDVLITDAERASVLTSRRKDRDAALIDTITATLSSRSSLLLPCDSSTRILELLVLLDQHWSYSKLHFPICLLSRTGREMLTFVRSMMEWLGGTISKEDVGDDGKRRYHNRRRRDEEEGEDALGALALRFKHLEFFPNPQALLQRHSSKDPKLILAVPASLSHGPSRHLFADFAAVPDNVVLLTQRGPEGTLSRSLFDHWNEAQRGDTTWDKGKIGRNVMLDGSIKLKMCHKVPLQGAELEEYIQKERAAKDKEAAHQAAMARNQRMLEADEDDSDESESDSDEDDEDEIQEALGADMIDSDDEAQQPKPPSKRKRKGNKDVDAAEWGEGDEALTKQLLSYDIYLKGKVAKSTSFFKSVGGQAQRFRMFPHVDKRRRVDEFGETIDVGMWLRKGKALEEEAEKEETEQKPIEEDEKLAEPPSKYVESEVEVQLACRLLFIDMEGLNDGRAVKTIVPQVNPRKMIIVHASELSTQALIESSASIKTMTKDIFAPTAGETIQIGQQVNSFSISISDEMLKSLRMSRFEDNEVAYVRGRVVAHPNSIIPILEPTTASLPSTSAPRELGARKLGSRPQVALPHSTMIGELKLTALKARLASVGIQAELIGEGVLVCGAGAKAQGNGEGLEETVAVRKKARGSVELEGNVSDIYYTVRREIYNLHALVAAI